jgi:hypothetical protein
MYLDTVISEALEQPPRAITYWISRRLREWFPERGIVETEDWDFRLEEAARGGVCRLELGPVPHAETRAQWTHEAGVKTSLAKGWYCAEWQGRQFDVLTLALEETCTCHHWILGEDQAEAEAFFEAVCSWKGDARGEILIFEGGQWRSSGQLYEELAPFGYENLILEPSFKATLRADLERFFRSRKRYEVLGAPWKRGLLFLGPPGNGKTHAIKGLAQVLGIPTLYVKSFEAERMIDVTNIRRVFERARRQAPCLLVLEDLDTLIDQESTSYFLNELDGFAANTGIAVIATTNHPERLDPAILERPSRFDRKYHFGLPGLMERKQFLEQWLREASRAIVWSSEELEEVVAGTEGFSFAYLKELCLAATLSYAESDTDMTFGAMIRKQLQVLRAEMLSTREAVRVRGTCSEAVIPPRRDAENVTTAREASL